MGNGSIESLGLEEVTERALTPMCWHKGKEDDKCNACDGKDTSCPGYYHITGKINPKENYEQ